VRAAAEARRRSQEDRTAAAANRLLLHLPQSLPYVSSASVIVEHELWTSPRPKSSCLAPAMLARHNSWFCRGGPVNAPASARRFHRLTFSRPPTCLPSVAGQASPVPRLQVLAAPAYSRQQQGPASGGQAQGLPVTEDINCTTTSSSMGIDFGVAGSISTSHMI